MKENKSNDLEPIIAQAIEETKSEQGNNFALDRIFDDATVFNIKGERFRGKKLETVAQQTSKVKAPISTEVPTP